MRRRRGPGGRGGLGRRGFGGRGLGRGGPLRRPGMRIGRRRIRHTPLPERAHKDLRRANHLTEQGDHLNASVIFERLANEAFDRDILRHAPMLFMQAAHAYILAGEVDKGIDLAKRGFGILADSQRWQKLKIAGDRIISTLTDAGYTSEPSDLQSWLDELLLSHGEKQFDQKRIRRELPPKCPYCGASIRSDEVNWINNKSAECIYCGSSVPTIK